MGGCGGIKVSFRAGHGLEESFMFCALKSHAYL